MGMEAQAYLAGTAMVVARVAVYATIVLMALCSLCAAAGRTEERKGGIGRRTR